MVVDFNTIHFVMSRERWAIRGEKGGFSDLRSGWPKDAGPQAGSSPVIDVRSNIEAVS